MFSRSPIAERHQTVTMVFALGLYNEKENNLQWK